ncbi:FAD-dependent monooxygenase [Streptomyces daliensis]|uniref:FAD-dependent monooxygenase n=1 Tax=Streptomyces daliensis TaxID=299421 RepID=A0A8T4IKQ4_9ACTN|nr:FAD-dependent monooxygenase [Streptomyces daliensis]
MAPETATPPGTRHGTQPDTWDTQVLVVGAGPVGLMLAGELRLGGADVVVLEQRAAPVEESRASTLHARTMEILDSRGLLARFGTLPNQRRGHFGGIPMDLTLPGPYPGQWKVPQPTTERLLQDWALSLGADVRRGHTLRGLTDNGDHVAADVEGPEGPLRLRAAYLVGCDGERGDVRRLAGIGLRGTEAGRELVRADVADIDIRDRRFERLERGLAIASRGAGGLTRVMAHAYGRPPRDRGGKAPDFTEVAEVWHTVTGEDISHGTPVWTNAFGDVCLQATDYRRGRVLLAGDAAHQQLPAGGQALNLGLQDAVNLGWKLARTVLGTAPGTLLDTYHAERHTAGARILANIQTQALLLLGGREADGPRAVMTELIAYEPAVRRRLAGMVSGLGVAYGTDEDGHPLLGVPLPHLNLVADGAHTTSAALLREGRPVLLSLGGAVEHGGSARLAAAVAPWAGRVSHVRAALAPMSGPASPDASGGGAGTVSGSASGAAAPVSASDSACPGYPEPRIDSGEAVLLRPDGHVAWAGTGEETGALTEALRYWFGPPDVGSPRTGPPNSGPPNSPQDGARSAAAPPS